MTTGILAGKAMRGRPPGKILSYIRLGLTLMNRRRIAVMPSLHQTRLARRLECGPDRAALARFFLRLS